MVKRRRQEAFKIFHRIAKSNRTDHLIDWRLGDESAAEKENFNSRTENKNDTQQTEPVSFAKHSKNLS